LEELRVKRNYSRDSEVEAVIEDLRFRHIELAAAPGRSHLHIQSCFHVQHAFSGDEVCRRKKSTKLITGSIDKYAVEKAAKESLSDYLWWRGAGVPKAHYVTASFINESGNPFTITRTRERGSDRSPEEIHAALCRGPAPDDALRQPTRTSIVRDEWIAALSLDLTETERFDLVRSALGALEGSEPVAEPKRSWLPPKPRALKTRPPMRLRAHDWPTD